MICGRKKDYNTCGGSIFKPSQVIEHSHVVAEVLGHEFAHAVVAEKDFERAIERFEVKERFLSKLKEFIETYIKLKRKKEFQGTLSEFLQTIPEGKEYLEKWDERLKEEEAFVAYPTEEEIYKQLLFLIRNFPFMNLFIIRQNCLRQRRRRFNNNRCPRKIQIMLFVAMILMLSLFSDFVRGEEKWKELKSYKSQVITEDYEEILGEVYFSPKEIKKMIKELQEEMKEKDFVWERIYTPHQHIGLIEFLGIKFRWTLIPRIEKIIKIGFFKKYDFFYIEDIYNIEREILALMFAVRRDGKKVYRFGLLWADKDKRTLFGEIAVKDMKSFNRIMKEEKLKVSSPELALDIGLLFVKVTDYINEELAISWENIKPLVGERFKTSEEKVNELKKIFHPPLYKRQEECYELMFFTYLEGVKFENGKLIPSGEIIWMKEWQIEVSKDGKVRLLNLKKIY